MTENKETTVSYSRDLVLAAACAAQRINGKYVKRDSPQGFRGFRYSAPEKKPNANSTKLPNRTLMKAMLESDRSDILPEDYAEAEAVRTYFCSMITLVFSGDARDFIKAAVDVATSDEIPEMGQMFGVAASLPSIYKQNIKRKIERDYLQSFINDSTPLTGHLGETVKLNVTVLDSIYKDRFGSNAVNALVNNMPDHHVVFFFDRNKWIKGNIYNMSGRIKAKHQQTTQLHYVRQVTNKEMSANEPDII
jgi:hypothetical protein